MARNRAETLRDSSDAWAVLTTPRQGLRPYTRAEAACLVTAAHQASAFSNDIRKVIAMRDALEMLDPHRFGPTLCSRENLGVKIIDELTNATADVDPHYRRVLQALRLAEEAVLRLFSGLKGKKGRLRSLAGEVGVVASFVRLSVKRHGLRPATPLEMEALVRLAEDRDETFPPPLDDSRARRRRRQAWKTASRKSQRVVDPFLKELTDRMRKR
jgi:hypothetical protein